MNKRNLDSLVADIASDVPVDWRAVGDEARLGPESGFRIIAAIGAGRPRPDDSTDHHRIVRILLEMAVALALVKVAVAVVSLFLATPLRFGPRALLTIVFSAAGVLLLGVGRRDVRAVRLAGLLVLIAAPFAQAYVMRAVGGPLGGPAFILAGATPEAFLALALWSFAWSFPAAPRTRAAKKLGRVGLAVAAAVGTGLFVVNVVREFASFSNYPFIESTLRVLDRSADTLVFWPLVFGIALLALPYLLWKSMTGTVDERTRAVCLPLSLLVGLLPIGLAVVLAPFVPALRASDFRDVVGVGLYVALASLIPSTAYLVLVQKALRVHVVIKRAARHALARQLVGTLILLTLSYVAMGLYQGRQQPLDQLLSGQLGLITVAATGFLALTFRTQLLNRIDRWFERGTADYSEAMARLGDQIRGQRTLRELQATVTRELTRTLDASRVAVLVMNEERSAFIGLDQDVDPLPLPSAIVELFQARRAPLCLTADEGHEIVARLLPADERRWLATVGVDRAFPLRDSTDNLFGLLCIGQARDATFTARDRTLVTVLADQLAMRLENLSHPTRNEITEIDWRNEPATQCRSCSKVSGPDAVRCACGSALDPAALPLVLNGKFEVRRVLGVGGMSVVYLAFDIGLKRLVAIKAMPKVTPTHIARLAREAQAMAAVRHPHLAMIYGTERWRAVPLLVVEYLDGGTLLDGLRAQPMAVDETLDLGIVLADALDRMHSSGLLHRDIKPSNIGYAGDGTAKLLDFGLAAALRGVDDEASEATISEARYHSVGGGDSWSSTASRTLTQHLVGTPLYLSPEALGGEQAQPSFDLWSLSLVLYEAIAGRHPFAGYPTDEVMRRTRSVRIPDVRDFRPDCHPSVAAFLNDALSLSKERRPKSAAELRTQLQTLRRAFASPAARLPGHPLY